MKAIFRPLYLFIAATVLVAVLLIGLVVLENSPSEVTSKVYVIGYDSTFNPNDVAGKERQFSAFIDELIERVGDIEEISVMTDTMSYDGLFPALRRRVLDAVCTADTPVETLAKGRYAFSDPIYDFGPVVVVRSDSKAASLEDLKGMVIGITKGSTLASELSLDPTIYVVTYDGVLQALTRLHDKTVDAVLLPFVPAWVYSHSLFKDQMRVATPPLIKVDLRLVMLGDPTGLQLLRYFNNGIEEMRKNGDYQTLLERWGLPDPTKPE